MFTTAQLFQTSIPEATSCLSLELTMFVAAVVALWMLLVHGDRIPTLSVALAEDHLHAVKKAPKLEKSSRRPKRSVGAKTTLSSTTEPRAKFASNDMKHRCLRGPQVRGLAEDPTVIRTQHLDALLKVACGFKGPDCTANPALDSVMPAQAQMTEIMLEDKRDSDDESTVASGSDCCSCDTPPSTGTISDDDSLSDSGSIDSEVEKVSVEHWHAVGQRLVGVLQPDSDSEDEDVSRGMSSEAHVEPWHSVGQRLRGVLQMDPESDPEDVDCCMDSEVCLEQWYAVGQQLVGALQMDHDSDSDAECSSCLIGS